MSRGLAVVYLAAAAVEGTVIGALLTFSSEPLYTTYMLAPRITELSVLQDQQLAGLIMWVPSGLVYLSAILVQIGLLLRSDEQNDPSRLLPASRRSREQACPGGEWPHANLTHLNDPEPQLGQRSKSAYVSRRMR